MSKITLSSRKNNRSEEAALQKNGVLLPDEGLRLDHSRSLALPPPPCRIAVGSNLFADHRAVASTLPDRESRYFEMFLNENDPEKRQKILNVVPEETARALQAQWILRQEEIRAAEGESEGLPAQGGRLVTQEGLKAWKSSRTDLNYGDFQRSQEIAEFFARRGYQLPDSDSELWSGDLDYEDVKLKIIEQEGYDQVSRSGRSQKTSRARKPPVLV